MRPRTAEKEGSDESIQFRLANARRRGGVIMTRCHNNSPFACVTKESTRKVCRCAHLFRWDAKAMRRHRDRAVFQFCAAKRQRTGTSRRSRRFVQRPPPHQNTRLSGRLPFQTENSGKQGRFKTARLSLPCLRADSGFQWGLPRFRALERRWQPRADHAAPVAGQPSANERQHGQTREPKMGRRVFPHASIEKKARSFHRRFGGCRCFPQDIR